MGGSSFAQVLNKLGKEAPDVTDAAAFKNTFNTLQELIKEGKIQAGHDVGSGGLITTLLEMCFADLDLGATLDLTALGEEDNIKLLFAENVAIVFQAEADVEANLNQAGISFAKIGTVSNEATVTVKNHSASLSFDVAALRDTWYKTSYLLDQQQSGEQKAKERFDNYKNQPLNFSFPKHFEGKKPVIDADVRRPQAAIIREKGSNSERELAQALFLAGFDVKDIHMTDLVSGRENLEDIQFLGAVGGFSNSDVLGSAKGWAGAFKYNEKARTAIENFFKREDTLSIGICNGCQLFVELGLIYPDHDEQMKMLHNDSHKHESVFTSMRVQANDSVMFSTLADSVIGVWVSHGEGKFHLPKEEADYKILAKYGYEGYPANPNGSDFNTAVMSDATGRHLVTMPHIERSIFQWQWAHYPGGRQDEVSPWMEAFVNAKNWLTERNK